MADGISPWFSVMGICSVIIVCIFSLFFWKWLFECYVCFLMGRPSFLWSWKFRGRIIVHCLEAQVLSIAVISNWPMERKHHFIYSSKSLVNSPEVEWEEVWVPTLSNVGKMPRVLWLISPSESHLREKNGNIAFIELNFCEWMEKYCL